VPESKFKTAVSLEQIKADPKLENMKLLKQSRLSVVPVDKAEFERIVSLAG